MAEESIVGEGLSLSITEKAGCLVELTITLEPTFTAQTYTEALAHVSRRATLPGFRKGRVPEEKIKKHYNREISTRWREITAERALRQAFQLSHASPLRLDAIKADLKELSLDGGVLEAEYEREPQPPSSLNLEEIKLTAPESKPIEEEEIQSELRGLKFLYAKKEPIEQAIEMGDLVLFDLFLLANEEKALLQEKARLIVGEGKEEDRWLSDSLIGRTSGDQYEVERPSTKEGEATSQIQVEIREAYSMDYPSDETLCAQTGMDSIEALRAKIMERIEKERAEQADFSLREELWKALLERYSFELPHSIVASEQRVLLAQRLQALRERGVPESTLIEEETKLLTWAESQAQVHLRRFFLARQVVSRANLMPSKKELLEWAYDAYAEHKLLRRQRPSMHDFQKDPAYQQRWESHVYVQKVEERAEELLLSQLGYKKNQEEKIPLPAEAEEESQASMPS